MTDGVFRACVFFFVCSAGFNKLNIGIICIYIHMYVYIYIILHVYYMYHIYVHTVCIYSVQQYKNYFVKNSKSPIENYLSLLLLLLLTAACCGTCCILPNLPWSYIPFCHVCHIMPSPIILIFQSTARPTYCCRVNPRLRYYSSSQFFSRNKERVCM